MFRLNRSFFLVAVLVRVFSLKESYNDVNNVEDHEVAAPDTSQQLYGTEISWPMQRPYSKSEDTSSIYEKYMQGCYDAYSPEQCDANEEDRIRLNSVQPALQRNFTAAGYAKVSAPKASFASLRRFWDEYSGSHLTLERWDEANIYTNHWESPTRELSVHLGAGSEKENTPGSRQRKRARRPASPPLSVTQRREIIAEVQAILEKWTGVALQPTSLYGIRVYSAGSVLAPHVDRLPLVISAIINVAQDVIEDWVLEVIGHDGVAVNITMEPGSMLLYESHSIIHGRPYPLRGTYYANCFLHFEPLGYSASLERRLQKSMSTEEKFAAALAKQGMIPDQGRAESKRSGRSLPSYIQEGTVEASRWRQEFVFSRVDIKQWVKPKTSNANNAHVSAAMDDVDRLREIAEVDATKLDEADMNGWKPIHEAARGGNVNAINYLLTEHEIDINERTNGGKGGSPLWWAEQGLPEGHPALDVLRKHGAIAIPPERRLLNN